MTGFIYVIKAGDHGPLKIGYTTSPKSRIASLQTANAERLNLLALFPGSEADEGAFHRAAASKTVSGEWFEDCDEVRQLFRVAVPASEPNEWRDELNMALALARDELLRAQISLARNDADGVVNALESAATVTNGIARSLKAMSQAAP